jgi:Glycosyltransferase
MTLRRLTVIWHEAGNSHYHDRFVELSKVAELTVMGPSSFAGKAFDKEKFRYPVRLFDSVLTSHWLTYFPRRWSFYAEARKSSILYVHEEPHSLVAFLTAITRFRRPMYIESSAINLKGNFFGLNIFEKFVYRTVTKIIPKNHEVAQVLRKRGAPSQKISDPIGNGVSRSTFSVKNKSAARTELERKYPQVTGAFQKHGMMVGYAGRIWRAKGLETLCQLASDLPINVIVCGPVQDEYLVEKLQDAGVIVLPSLEENDLRTFYSALDLFILPSLSTKNWREQFGRVCIEAIFCGTPAVGSNVGGIPLVIGIDQTFEPGNISQMKDRITAMANEAVRAQVLAWQTAHVDEKFSWKAIARQVLDVTEY